ncbi:MAG TPA: hypothetical protein VF883_01215 [Thermoanaerobaculia bacterium]
MAEELRKEQREAVIKLPPEERIALAHRLGAEAAAMFASARRIDLASAERHLKQQRRAGRRPSRCMEDLDP